MNQKMLIVLLGLLFTLILTSNAFSITRTCNSCETCTGNLSIANSGDIISITTSLSSSNTCIESTVSGVTINCNGNTLTGIGVGRGIHLFEGSSNTIKNCKISTYNEAIFLQTGMDNNIIEYNEFTNCNYGLTIGQIETNDAHGNIVRYNNASSITGTAILSLCNDNINCSSNTYYSNNILSDVFNGFDINGHNSIIRNNYISSTNIGILVPNSNNVQIYENLVLGSNSNSGIKIEGGTNNTIRNNNITSITGNGINLQSLYSNVNFSSIFNNIISNVGSHGIISDGCSYLNITQNLINASSADSIRLYSSNYNNVTYNNVIDGGWVNIRINQDSSYNEIRFNNVTSSNEDGIAITGGSSNINNIISYNKIEQSGTRGVYFDSSSPFNTVTYNDIIANSWSGIRIESTNNTISNNDIFDQIGATGLIIAANYNNVSKNLFYDNDLNLEITSGTSQYIYYNKFLNTSNNGAHVSSSVTPLELSYYSIGNYWGHDVAPCFDVNTDTTDPAVNDSFPLCSETGPYDFECNSCNNCTIVSSLINYDDSILLANDITSSTGTCIVLRSNLKCEWVSLVSGDSTYPPNEEDIALYIIPKPNYPPLTPGRVYGCWFENFTYAIKSENLTELNLTDNIFFNNTYGLETINSNNLKLYNNLFDYNYYGINLSNVINLTMVNNTATNSASTAFYIFGTNGLLDVDGNNASYNSGKGFDITFSNLDSLNSNIINNYADTNLKNYEVELYDINNVNINNNLDLNSFETSQFIEYGSSQLPDGSSCLINSDCESSYCRSNLYYYDSKYCATNSTSCIITYGSTIYSVDTGTIAFTTLAEGCYNVYSCLIGTWDIIDTRCTLSSEIYSVQYSTFGESGLLIYNDGDELNIDINFYANYTNITDNTTINDGNCQIWFEDELSWYPMNFDGTLHNYTRNYSSTGYKFWNVSCTSTSFDSLNAGTWFLISPQYISGIPELSDYALMLVIAMMIGVVVYRRKN